MHSDYTPEAGENRFRRAMRLAAACLVTAALLFTPFVVLAQTGARGQETTRQSITDQEIQLMRQDIRAERRQVVAANLPLTTEESAKFWPLYDQYIGETVKINDVRYGLVKDYVSGYSTMSDLQAADFIRKWIDLDKSMIELRLKYVPIVEKVLPSKKAAMFMQIDRRVQLLIDIQLSSQLPLINPPQ